MRPVQAKQKFAQGYFYFQSRKELTIMSKLTTKITVAKIKAESLVSRAKTRFLDTRGDGHVDTATKIIIGVVIGALVLAGLVVLWNVVIMPRLNTEVTSMFG
jgi:hypothetical protein